MRKGIKPELIIHNDIVVGVNMSSDFCAEHEWGIDNIRDNLGCKKASREVLGIESRKIFNIEPDSLFYVKGKKFLLLALTTHIDNDDNRKALMDSDKLDKGESPFRDLHCCDDQVTAAWSEDDFGIIAPIEHIQFFDDLYEAMITQNAAIWFSSKGAWIENAGLCIGIIDRMPPEFIESLHAYDVDQYQLLDASNATGIKEKIDKLNEVEREKTDTFSPRLGYHALSPRWISEGEKSKSKHPVIYWLNPMNQDKTNFGWYTVEILEQWVDGKGPIPMSNKELKERRRIRKRENSIKND